MYIQIKIMQDLTYFDSVTILRLWPYTGLTLYRTDRIQDWPCIGLTVYRTDRIQDWPYTGLTVYRTDRIQDWQIDEFEVNLPVPNVWMRLILICAPYNFNTYILSPPHMDIIITYLKLFYHFPPTKLNFNCTYIPSKSQCSWRWL